MGKKKVKLKILVSLITSSDKIGVTIALGMGEGDFGLAVGKGEGDRIGESIGDAKVGKGDWTGVCVTIISGGNVE